MLIVDPQHVGSVGRPHPGRNGPQPGLLVGISHASVRRTLVGRDHKSWTVENSMICSSSDMAMTPRTATDNGSSMMGAYPSNRPVVRDAPSSSQSTEIEIWRMVPIVLRN